MVRIMYRAALEIEASTKTRLDELTTPESVSGLPWSSFTPDPDED